MKLRILGLSFALFLSACTSSRIVEEMATYPVGDQTVRAVTLARPGLDGLVFLNLHDDENTSVDAARVLIGQRGGRLVALQHTGARNVTFTLGGTTYEFDPNRMFTDAGARRTLERESTYSEAAHAVVRRLADQLLADHGLDRAPVIVTLHNNTDENYSARSYAEGGDSAADAAAVHLIPNGDPDDFFFVTDRRLYDALAARHFNVVLQDNENATDDGSLSVFAGQRGLPYVNVEAQHGHLEEQLAMIRALVEVLTEQGYVRNEN